MSETNEMKSIQKIINHVTVKIKQLCDDEINTKYTEYLEKLVGDSMILMRREQFKKIDGAYQKLKKQLKSFRLTVIHDCTELMQIAIEMDLMKRRFDDLQKEYDQLKKSLESVPMNQNDQIHESFKSGQYLSILIQMHAKAQKVIKSYNDRIVEYNSYMDNFNLFLTELNRGYIIYTSPVTDKSYSILLTDIVKEISMLINPSGDILEMKRNQVFELFQTEYNKQLNNLISDSKLEKITALNETLLVKPENDQ